MSHAQAAASSPVAAGHRRACGNVAGIAIAQALAGAFASGRLPSRRGRATVPRVSFAPLLSAVAEG